MSGKGQPKDEESLAGTESNKQTKLAASLKPSSSLNDDDDDLMTDDSAVEKPSIIQVQKYRAKQQLAGKHHPTLQAIQAALDNGRVKPLFHTHFLPESFLGNHRSLSDVTAGEVDRGRQLEFDFYANNLDKVVVVDESGNARGAGSIIDDGMGKKWRFDCYQTAFAVELVNTDAEMLGEDIECTKLTSIPIRMNARDASYDLLTRSESRGVVHDIFHRFGNEPRRGSVATIFGSEGIGKSWTLLYALQQALLYDGATVLFFFQKSNDAVLYLRRNNKMYAWTSTRSTPACSCLFKRSDVLVLLDPKDADRLDPTDEDRGDEIFAMGKMKLLYAAYNNKVLISSMAEKSNGQMHAFLGPPLDSELRVILKHLDPSLTQDVIDERKKNIGNLIRYILDERVYHDRVKATGKAVDKCAASPDLLRQALWDDGMSKGRGTVAGTVFHLFPTRPDEIGYDGQGIEYRKRVLVAANEAMRNAIEKAGQKVMLLYKKKVSGDE